MLKYQYRKTWVPVRNGNGDEILTLKMFYPEDFAEYYAMAIRERILEGWRLKR